VSRCTFRSVGRQSIVVTFGLWLLLSGTARADLIFSGTGTDTSDGAPISATADFSFDSNTNVLTIVLTNNDVAASQGSVLTELQFNAPATASSLPGSSGSAALTAGSNLVVNGTLDSHTVGQEWQYVSGSSGGLGSSGFGPTSGSGNLC